MAFAAKIYKQGVQVLLAACDEDLLGDLYREGRFRLEVRPGFYDGERVDSGVLEAMMARCTLANLVGPRTVDLAVRLGLVDTGQVLEIEGVPHAQFMVLDT